MAYLPPQRGRMIRSMTAFASGERSTPWGTLGCELRAVNHRFLELGLRLPDELRALEPALRERWRARRARQGRPRLAPAAAGGGEGLQLNPQVLDQLSSWRWTCPGASRAASVEFTDLLRFPGVIEQAEVDPAEACRAEALALLDEVLDDFIAAREREARQAGRGDGERLDGIERIAAEVRRCCRRSAPALRAKLDARLADLKQPLDPGRLEQELVLQLQKIDVDEELDRLDSHVAECARCLAAAKRSAAGSISCCRSSTARPTPWARSRSTRAPRRPRSS
jgi:uncharacterized protein (TIGR00255 family)